MLIKFYIQPDAYLVFRSEDITSIEPFFTTEADVLHYRVRLSTQKQLLKINVEQADRLTEMLNCTIVRSSYCEDYELIDSDLDE